MLLHFDTVCSEIRVFTRTVLSDEAVDSKPLGLVYIISVSRILQAHIFYLFKTERLRTSLTQSTTHTKTDQYEDLVRNMQRRKTQLKTTGTMPKKVDHRAEIPGSTRNKDNLFQISQYDYRRKI